MEKNKAKKLVKKLLEKKWLYIITASALLVMLITIFVAVQFSKAKSKPEIIPEPEVVTESSLEKIINVSELSTFMVVYNGIAKIMDEAKSENVSYYVAYEAKVKAGIKTEDVEIKVDNAAKEIYITLPDVYLTEVDVDHSSVEFMFVDDKANTSTVTEKAFKACEEDVSKECEKQSAIFELASQNAVNIVKALTKPILQLNEYKLFVNN
ncbi:MAG: DUF4230 domain-containing protein [Candidatus Flemingiibacterium sp.]